MHENKNGMVGWLLICFTLLIVTTAQAYSYSDYYDENEEDNEELEYYDYHTGRWETIPEPDPYCYPVSYSHSHRTFSPISAMIPLFIIFFVIFLPWLVYVLAHAAVGK